VVFSSGKQILVGKRVLQIITKSLTYRKVKGNPKKKLGEVKRTIKMKENSRIIAYLNSRNY
jgi:hypothetical protein